ncbi:MAG: dTDP-4-dehydrorhamnose reductase [Candidatus Dormiibacterota bacterium]
MAEVEALVLGARGQLGTDLVRLLPDGAGIPREAVSVIDMSALKSLFEARRPAVVFNCAAYNAVDRAEVETELAYQVNSEGAWNVAIACRRSGARLIHFSTNFVFDGELDRPYVESDRPAPGSAYARSKLEGEQRVLDALPTALVIRTAALFGDSGSSVKGGSFPERIVSRALLGETIRVVADQKVNPTYTRDLAPAAISLAEAGLSGLVHVVAEGCCGWDELARVALAECGVTAQVLGISSRDLASPAPRPLNGCLASTRTAALRPWREGVREWARRRAMADPADRG